MLKRHALTLTKTQLFSHMSVLLEDGILIARTLQTLTGNFRVQKVGIRLPEVVEKLRKQSDVVVALLEYVVCYFQSGLHPALMYKHVHSVNQNVSTVCIMMFLVIRVEWLLYTHLKSISSTLIELISTTNMLKSTITGDPFFEGGRISENKQIGQTNKGIINVRTLVDDRHIKEVLNGLTICKVKLSGEECRLTISCATSVTCFSQVTPIHCKPRLKYIHMYRLLPHTDQLFGTLATLQVHGQTVGLRRVIQQWKSIKIRGLIHLNYAKFSDEVCYE